MTSWGNLPDFELRELWLRPRLSAVDRGEVESVRLKVDVHVVRKDAQVSPFFFELQKEEIEEQLPLSLVISPEFFSSLTLSPRVTVERQHPNSPPPPVVTGLQSATAKKTWPPPTPPPYPPPFSFLSQNAQSPRLPGSTQAH